METTVKKVSVRRKWILPDGVKLAPGDRARLASWRQHPYLHVLVIEGAPASGKTRLANALALFLRKPEIEWWDDRTKTFEMVARHAAASGAGVVLGDMGAGDRKWKWKGLLEYKHSSEIEYRRLGQEQVKTQLYFLAVIITGCEVAIPEELVPWTMRIRCVG